MPDYGEDMTVEQIHQEVARRAKEARDLELQQAAAASQRETRERQQRLAQEAARKQQREEAMRTAAEAQMREEIRQDFMATHTAATEEDFERLYPQLRDRYLLESRESVIAASRANSRYNI